MINTKKWVAAGSTATLLAGGLFLGAPMASAAPGDAACLQASTQFNAALGLAGVDVGFVNQFEAATAAVVAAAANYDAISASLNVEALVAEADRTNELAEVAQVAVENAQIAVDAAVVLATGENTDGDGNPENDQRVIDARAALKAASTEETTAVQAAVDAGAAAEAVSSNADLVTAVADLEAKGAQADALLAQLSGNEALAGELLALFKAFLAACDASAIGVDPAPVAPAPVVPAGQGVTPVGPAPVAPVVVAPVAPGAVAAPTGTNKGLNVQTAVATEDNSAAVALIAALLAAGVAVSAVTAARMRRLERAQH
ncbi:hypothetical protein [Arthrobacter pityocampae]|uniref:hypothetical protein n=1 Tax=Arthrobacter pityocampae TaxID=547334 RepID=UPI00142E8764|nr:hypothetical protein [Arthrobacter pityocampae]